MTPTLEIIPGSMVTSSEFNVPPEILLAFPALGTLFWASVMVAMPYSVGPGQFGCQRLASCMPYSFLLLPYFSGVLVTPPERGSQEEEMGLGTKK